MDLELTPIEVRVLGCLIEKERTTPDYYPLTLNALTNACNQKSNRDPVMMLMEKSIVRTLDTLRMDHQLAVQVTSTESRVPKYRHCIRERWTLSPAELALLCELFLRGPQTPGDLRARSARLHPFADRDEVEATLQQLAQREDGPFVQKLPRVPGKREQRWAHLFSGVPEMDEEAPELRLEPVRIELEAEDKRIAELESAVAELREQMSQLQAELVELKSLFE